MGAAGQRLGLRLFLEGIEVPVISAQVQIGINAPATAAIQIVPGDKVLDLKARTMVHLFFWDFTLDNDVPPLPPDPQIVAQQYGVTVEEARKIISDSPDNFGSSEEDDLTGYKLLFSGEVIGVVMAKTPDGRQAVLQCSDFSTYWDTTYQFFVSYSPGGNFLGTDSYVWAGGASMFDDLTAGHVSVMGEYLRSRPKTPGLQNVKGLMGGIISLLEAMGGVPNHAHGVNDFFTIAELKNHLLQQIVAEQNDDTAQQLFDDKAFMDWLTRGMSSLGQLTTFRDMMKLLFKYVYYEVVPNPAAMYVPSTKTVTSKKTVRSKVEVDLDPALKGELQDYYEESDRHFQVAYFRSGSDKDHLVSGNHNDGVLAKSLKTAIKNTIARAKVPAAIRGQLELAVTWLDKIKTVENVQAGSNQVPDTRSLIINVTAWKKVRDIIGGVLKQQIFDIIDRNVQKTTPGELDRLHTQIFRPDCFFAAPPRCNVIFPEQYTTFQFSRNFLQEVTRLRLSVDWLFGGDSGGLLAEYHFAPATSEIRALAKQQGNEGIRALLPWEKYSGILPKFETIHEVNYVAGRGERQRGIKGNIKGAATNYAARTANFNYMKYRFAARTCEVTTKFNPFMVAGFPAVVIEKPFILDPEKAEEIRNTVQSLNPNQHLDDMSEMVRTAARIEQAPTQYLGMIAAMSHSVQQDGGSTSIVLTHARTHRITSDDFLGIFSKQLTTEVDTVTVSTELDAEELFKKGDWKKLKFLMDATPQNLHEQARALQDEQTSSTTDSLSDVEQRPMGFGGLLANPKTKPVRVTVPSSISSSSSKIPIRGKVKKDRLKDSRQIILVPDSGGSLSINSTGPKGGKITQIQCVTDAAVGVVGNNVSKRLKANQSIIISSNTDDEFLKDPVTGKLLVRGNIVGESDIVYFWKKIVIFEEKKVPKRTSELLPVEEGLRPPWFSPLYSNWFIGDGIYRPFFGCGSIVDQSLFITDQGSATFGTGRSQQQKVLDDLKAANGDKAKMLKIIEDAKAKNITDVPDIESSVDVIAYIYGEVRRLGLDIHRFINEYTRRPIATMEDIFGSSDLAYKISGNKLELVSGTPGFHSTAIANVGGNLLGLLDNPDVQLPRLKSGAGGKSPVSKDLDPRPGRRAQVELYVTQIEAAHGGLGVGVSG